MISSRSSNRQSRFLPEEGKSPPLIRSLIDFDGTRLAEELLSLGNPKITRPIAQLIAQEVEKELKEEEPPLINAEVISNLVRFKLEELGLIEIRSPRPRSKKPAAEKSMKTIHPFAVRNPSVRIEVKSFKPSLRKVDLHWSEEGREAFREFSLSKDGKTWKAEEVAAYLEELSQWVARAERPEEALPDREATAIHFYNPLASLEFLPGSAVLRTDLKTERPSGIVRGLHFIPTFASVFSMLQRIEREQKDCLPSTLSFSFLELSPEEKPEAWEATARFLKHLKTSFEHRETDSLSVSKQDLFFQLSETQDPSFLSVLQWLRKEENRSHFTLSLGVSGTLWDSLADRLRSAANPRETSTEESPLSAPETPGASSKEIASRDSEALNQIPSLLRDQLQADPHLRVFFVDRSQETNKTPHIREDRMPNPIAPHLCYADEWVPSAFLNLASMVEEEEISWDRLRRASRQAVHFLDNVIDQTVYPNEDIARATKANRSLAVGVMGWADLLYLLRIPYNSDEALELASRIAQFIQEEAVAASSELAKTRGVFPNYIGSVWQKRGIPVRNAHLTGLMWDPHPSNIAQVASGIEPHGVLVAPGEESGGRSRYLVHPFLAQVAKTRNFSHEAIFRKIAVAGSLQGIPEIPKDVQKVFVNAQDIDWEWQLRIAHAFEKHFDLGVAKLCPVKGSALEKNLEEVLQKAHDLRLRSLFLKRIGEVKISGAPVEKKLETSPPHAREEEEEVTQVAWLSQLEETKDGRGLENFTLRKRPERLTGSTYQYTTASGILYVTINEDSVGPFELFTQLTPSGNGKKSPLECNELLNTLARMVSYSFQRGVDPEEISSNLSFVGASSGGEALSLTDALSTAIVQHFHKTLEPTPQRLKLEDSHDLAREETSYSIFEELALQQDHLPEFSATIPPTAACVDCGKPFTKLNGSDSCSECKAAH